MPNRPYFKTLARDFLPVLLGAFIGIGGGLGAVGFKLLLEASHFLAWHQTGDFPSIVEGWSPVWILVIPTVGGLLVGLLTWFLAREAKGHGVPEVISAIVRKRGIIRPRVVLVKAFASAICIATGGSCGREGPIAQIGAAWGSTVGQWMPWQRNRVRVMVGAGAAAGISATFNAPIAGVIFSLEILLRDFSLKNLTPIIVSGVMAVTVSHTLLPDHTIFTIPPYQANHPVELAFYAILGLGAAVVGVLFIRCLYAMEDLGDKIPLPGWLKPALGGLGIGALALAAPQIMGVGYASVTAALDPSNTASLAGAGLGQITALTLLALLGAKILATSLTLGMGGSGGIFAPSLFMGAMYGGVFGYLVQGIFPGGGFAGPGAYALVGMAAVVSATTHAPLCSMLILFEMTNDYKIILPLMLASVLATLFAKRLCSESIYTMKMVRRGERIRYGADLSVLENIPVSEVMVETEVETLRPDTPLEAILSAIQSSRYNDLPILGEADVLEGMVYFSDVKPVMHEEGLNRLVIAADVLREASEVLRPQDTLDRALARFAETNADVLPVVSEGERMTFLGVLTRADLMTRYQAELVLSQD